jgi:hypothetical protein
MGRGFEMNTRGTILVGLCFLAIGLRTNAQCPADFQNLGQVSATVAPGRYQQVQVTRELSVPDGIQIDESYRQKTIQAASDGGASDMRAAQIPAGFHLVPGGQGGGWWSISNPELKQIPANGKDASHWIFRIDLYANSGGRDPESSPRVESRQAPSVWVQICAKTRH